MTYDIIKPKPKTQYGYFLVRMNNMQAQWIGRSTFSKKVKVQS